MSLFRNKYRVESNRWQFWDYSAPASYFITICAKDRKEIFGYIRNKKMILSDEGKIVARHFEDLTSYHCRIILDEWVVMPNHIHCIITLGGYDFDNTVDKIHEFYLHPNPQRQRPYIKQPTIDEIKHYRKKRQKMLIPKILGKFQMQTSKHINILNKTPGNKNWQRDYNDHVIRNYKAYQHIKVYIKNNPVSWEDDTFFNK